MANSSVIKAYLRLYSKAEIESALRIALGNHAAGVTLTSVGFDGSSGTGTITGKTEEIIETLTECLDLLDADPSATAPATRQLCATVDRSFHETIT